MHNHKEYMKSWSKETKKKRVENRLCIRCAKPLTNETGQKCLDCCKKRQEYSKKLYLSRLQSGKCPDCGKESFNGYGKCERCSEKRRRLTKSGRDKLREQHLCLNCKKPIGDFNSVEFCKDCYPSEKHRRWLYHDKSKFGGNRLTVLKRDNFKCRVCGSTRRLAVHHLDSNRSHNSVDNLMTLCCICHTTLTRLIEHPEPHELIKLLKFVPSS